MTESKLASKIVVDHDRHEVVVDGVALPFLVAETPQVAFADGLWSVTVGILAEDVEQVMTFKGDDND
jgi:hypothetical protein